MVIGLKINIHSIQGELLREIDHNISYHTILQFNQLYPSKRRL